MLKVWIDFYQQQIYDLGERQINGLRSWGMRSSAEYQHTLSNRIWKLEKKIKILKGEWR